MRNWRNVEFHEEAHIVHAVRLGKVFIQDQLLCRMLKS